MKFNHCAIVLSVAIFCTACSSVATRKIASGNFDYLKLESGEMIIVPDDLDTPSFSRDYLLPDIGENAPTDLVGKNLNIESPSLVIPMVSGSYIEEGSKQASIKFDQIDDSEPLSNTIWDVLIGYLESNNVAVDTFDPDTGVLVSDWMLETEEVESKWYSLSEPDVEIGRRFEFKLDVAPHGRTAELNVGLTDYLKTVNDEVVASLENTQPRSEEVNVLNKIVSFYDNELGLKITKFRAQIRRGLATEMGFNADGDPAFLVNEIYDVAWPRLLLVLRNLGFDVKDLDKSNGLMFVTYNGPGGGWWSNLFASGERLLDSGDYRLKVNDQGAKTAITFMTDASEPFEVNEVTELYKPFSEIMSKDNLDI